MAGLSAKYAMKGSHKAFVLYTNIAKVAVRFNVGSGNGEQSGCSLYRCTGKGSLTKRPASARPERMLEDNDMNCDLPEDLGGFLHQLKEYLTVMST